MTDQDGTQLSESDMLDAFGLDAQGGVTTAEDSRDADQRIDVKDLQSEADTYLERPDTALQVDEFAEFKAKSIIENPDYQGVWSADVETKDENGHRVTETVEVDPDHKMMADCFSAAFEIDPKLNLTCKDEERRAFFEALLETDEYRSLHKRTTLDSTASELASLHFAQQLVAMRADAQCNGTPQHSDADRQQFLNDMRNSANAQQAAQAASETVNQYDDACNAFGAGTEAGGDGKMDARTLGKLFQEVRSSEQLKRICELAGKYRSVAQNAQRKKVNHGMDDVVGVTLGSDLGRALPVELAMLNDPEFESLVLKKLLDASMMLRDHQGVDNVAKGPIMFFIDESGSMSGEKSYNGKALGLALGWIAQKQKRWFCLNAFSSYGRSGDASQIENELTQLRTIIVPPGRSMMGEMMEWMVQFQNGGTDVEFLHGQTISALYAKTKAEVGKTDIVLLTDGYVGVHDETKATFAAWKKQSQTTCHAIIIPPGDEKSLVGVADRVYRLDRLSFDQSGVGDVLSI